MFKNYFKIAWRHFRNNKIFSFINILGLSLGLTSSLLIFLWIRDERSIDHFHKNGNRLYILYEQQMVDGKRGAGYYTPGLLSAELKKFIPEVEYASGFMPSDGITFEASGKILKESGCFADSDYFKMFSYPLLQGTTSTALNTPASMAISNRMAEQFFGSAQTAIGKTIRYKNTKGFTVTAVFADLPDNVSQKFDFAINWMAMLDEYSLFKDWRNNSPQTYMLLHENARPALVKAKIKKFLDGYNKTQNANFQLRLGMQLYHETYLHAHFEDGEIEGGRIEYVRLFSLVAIFLLLIACINFMNLTTARSAKRTKEIGIRKVSGAVRGSLIRQFLNEAMLITLLSVLFSVLLVNLLLPSFNLLTGKQIHFPFSDPDFWIALAVITMITGLISGSYPALFLSSFKPIQVLKGPLKFSGSTILFRKGLVVFQFVLSIVLIIGTIVVSEQINYVQHANLGYDRENLLYIDVEGELAKQYDVFKEESLRSPGIKNISSLSEVPAHIGGTITATVKWSGRDPDKNTMFTITAAGYDFVKTMDLKLLAGRDFSASFPSDSAGYLVNESAAALMNYRDPVGKPLELWGKKGTIIGVVKDFHLTSLQEPMSPLIVQLSGSWPGRCILVRTVAGKTDMAIASMEKIAKDLNPKFPFTYHFTDEEYQKLYKSEDIVSSLSDYFAALAIFISCMGLLGLAMFTAEQRRKEIGIRKVLGASVMSLFSLLSREFILLVMIALLIASPLAWTVMHNWLMDYAYRIHIGGWIFGFAGLMAIFIALLTVSFQALKSAFMNPVKSLRTE
ncbi:MAG: ABC transporter permease [Bacteroidota bacterium]|nr:ABC transporter permease [Bacteroidota bacterium]